MLAFVVSKSKETLCFFKVQFLATSMYKCRNVPMDKACR